MIAAMQVHVPPGHVPPSRASGARGYRLFLPARLRLGAEESAEIDTGVRIEAPPNHVCLVVGYARASLRVESSLVDSDDTGSVIVHVTARSRGCDLAAGTAIAYVIVTQTLTPAVQLVVSDAIP